MKTNYAERLKQFYKLDFANNIDRVSEMSVELLRWALTSLLLGNSIEDGKKWLEEQLKQPLSQDRPIANFHHLVNLAAAERLFDKQDTSTLKTVTELLPEIEEQPMFDTDKAIVREMAIGLWMVLNNENEIKFWREKRFEQEIYEGWEPSAFEILYSSGEQALADNLDNLVHATARVAVKTLYDRRLNSVAPLVFALAAHSARKKKSLADILHGKIFDVDKAVFRIDDTPFVNFDKPTSRSSSPASDTLVIKISQQITGAEELSTGNYEFAPFTTSLVPIVTKSFDKRKDQDSIKNIEVEGLLKLAGEVTISEEELENLERRMSVAIEHSIHYLEIFDKKVSFKLINR